MNRGTLINAVKTLRGQSSTRTGKSKLMVPTINLGSITPVTKPFSPQMVAHQAINADQTTHAGITPLGRTRIENFNL